MCVIADWESDSAERLYRSFEQYSKNAGIKKPRSKKSLGAVLRNQHKIDTERRATGYWWIGLRLKTEKELTEEPLGAEFDA